MSMIGPWTLFLSLRSSLPGKENLKLVLKEEVRQGGEKVFLFGVFMYFFYFFYLLMSSVFVISGI